MRPSSELAQRVITLLGKDSQNAFRLKGLLVMNGSTNSHTCLGALESSKGSGNGTSPFRLPLC